MDQITNGTSCQQTDELISAVYGEATESEFAHFRQHLQTCDTCETEIRAFSHVRESISNWKFEAFSSTGQSATSVSTQVPRTKSAVAALREFFDLSPFWLKATTALALILLCMAAVLTLAKFDNQTKSVVNVDSQIKVYTSDEVNEIVKRALEDQKSALQSESARGSNTPAAKVTTSRYRNSRRPYQMASDRRPLTRMEREQLAADLRLIEKDDDDGLVLLSEPLDRD